MMATPIMLAALAGGMAAVAIREAVLASPALGRWLAEAIEPLRRAGREGYAPPEAERRRLAALGTGAQAGQLGSRRSLDRVGGGGECRANRAATRQRIRDRGGNLRQAALDGAPVARPSARHRPGCGAGPGHRPEGRRPGADHEQPTDQ